tara:strand:+ start:68 stop:301 length:234 start_codon:yes stop_codon:yes gene_type:complete
MHLQIYLYQHKAIQLQLEVEEQIKQVQIILVTQVIIQYFQQLHQLVVEEVISDQVVVDRLVLVMEVLEVVFTKKLLH